MITCRMCKPMVELLLHTQQIPHAACLLHLFPKAAYSAPEQTTSTGNNKLVKYTCSFTKFCWFEPGPEDQQNKQMRRNCISHLLVHLACSHPVNQVCHIKVNKQTHALPNLCKSPPIIFVSDSGHTILPCVNHYLNICFKIL